MITVYQAQGSNVPPLADARLYELLSGGGVGVVLGCEITSLGGLQLRVGAGWVLLPGRCIAIEEETITVTPSTGAQVDGQVLLHLDVSSDENPGTLVTDAETPLPAPVQEDINGSGTIYELQMCTYQVDQLQVTDLQTTYPVLGTAASYLYKATFDMDSWTPGSGNVTQTATLVPVDGGPPVTSGSTLLAYEGIDSTLPQETKDAMSGPAGLIAKAAKTLGDNTITVTLDSAPDVDVEIFFSIKQGVTPAVPPLDPIGVGGGATVDLLWTNPNPAASFAPQSIQLGGKYDAFCVSFFAAASNNEQMQTQMVVADDGATTQRIGFVNYYTNVGTRDATVYKNLIAFGNSNSGSGGSTNNANIIPYKIYGVSFSGKTSTAPAPVSPGWTLLWANPSPTESFPPQDVNVALSGYDFLYIEFLPYGTGFEQWAGRTINIFSVGCVGNLSFALLNQSAGQTSASLEAINRLFDSDESGVHFQNAVSVVAGGKSSLTNQWAVPTKIWGVKL